MGQAKQRGTYAQRRQEAIALKAEARQKSLEERRQSEPRMPSKAMMLMAIAEGVFCITPQGSRR